MRLKAPQLSDPGLGATQPDVGLALEASGQEQAAALAQSPPPQALQDQAHSQLAPRLQGHYSADEIGRIGYAAAQVAHQEAHKGQPEGFYVSKDAATLAIKYPHHITELRIADLLQQPVPGLERAVAKDRLQVSFGDISVFEEASALAAKETVQAQTAHQARRTAQLAQDTQATSDLIASTPSIRDFKVTDMPGTAQDLFKFESSTWSGAGVKIPAQGFLGAFAYGSENRSVLQDPLTFSEGLGLGLRGLVQAPIRGVHATITEVGQQYQDAYSLITREGSGNTPNSALFSSAQQNGWGATLGNATYSALSAPTQPLFDLAAGNYESAGAGLPGMLGAGGAVRLTANRLPSWTSQSTSIWVPSPRTTQLYGGIPVQALFGDTRITTVTPEMTARFQGMGYLDPLSNTFKAAPAGLTMAVDHIYPSRKIIDLPGFRNLTKEQMTNILQDSIGLGNLQPLPKTFNSSKGSKTDWSMYGDQKLDGEYALTLIRRQRDMELSIIDQIRTYNNQNAKRGF